MYIVNKLNFIYFTWFVYTFVDYKYNVLLKKDDVCLMQLSTFVTLSRFAEGKEIRIVVVKWPRNPVLNVVPTLQQRRGNVLITSESDVVTTSAQPSFSTVPQSCDNVNNDVVTTLGQRSCDSWESLFFNKFASLSAQ